MQPEKHVLVKQILIEINARIQQPPRILNIQTNAWLVVQVATTEM